MGKSNNREKLGKENQSNNEGEILLTVKEVAVMIDESTDVVRNWIKTLKNHIPLTKNESGYNVFNDEALERMKLIKELHRDRNYSMKQIDHYFNTDGEAFVPAPKQSTDEALANELKSIREELKQQREFNKLLTERLDRQEERDHLLMSAIRQSQEKIDQQLQLAATKEPEKKKGGFLSWFRRN